jgi:hypothetical protein
MVDKVYVVWDPLVEEVVSVHKTQDGAEKKAEEKDKSDVLGEKRESYFHEWGEFELED